MKKGSEIKITECPRDAMQGIHRFIPTEQKAAYLNSLLKVGFDTLDFGSFVSPKAIPQMQDTVQVLDSLDISSSKTKLLAIVANSRGAKEAAAFSQIHYLGFPLSLSQTFQQRNTNKSIQEVFVMLDEIQNYCIQSGKELVVYLSMGFGNPYGDPYNPEVAEAFTAKLYEKGIKTVSLADTIASATPSAINSLFTQLSSKFPSLEFGVHLHTQRIDAYEKIKAAHEAGCRRMDGALLGFGGCPMAKDELSGNMPTEEIIRYVDELQLPLSLNRAALQESLRLAQVVFS